jgi:hypothetical protein
VLAHIVSASVPARAFKTVGKRLQEALSFVRIDFIVLPLVLIIVSQFFGSTYHRDRSTPSAALHAAR